MYQDLVLIRMAYMYRSHRSLQPPPFTPLHSTSRDCTDGKDEAMKSEVRKKKEDRETMLERAKRLAQQKTTDRDFMARSADSPRSDEREPEAGENV